jgi:hypothetical protein
MMNNGNPKGRRAKAGGGVPYQKSSSGRAGRKWIERAE